MVCAVPNDLQDLRPARWYWLITIVIVILVATAPWVGSPVVTAALGFLTAVLPLAMQVRLEGRRQRIVGPGTDS